MTKKQERIAKINKVKRINEKIERLTFLKDTYADISLLSSERQRLLNAL